MRAIISERAFAYGKPDTQSRIIAQLGVGSEVQLGERVMVDSLPWRQIQLDNGDCCFLEPEVGFTTTPRIVFQQAELRFYGEASRASRQSTVPAQDRSFLLLDKRDKLGESWLLLRDDQGQEGFVDGTTPYRLAEEVPAEECGSALELVEERALVERSEGEISADPEGGSGEVKVTTVTDTTPPSLIREAAARNMLVGALWCIGGIVVTAVTYSAAANGGTYVVTWGAIVFGGLQFLKGLFGLITAPSAEQRTN